MERSMIQEKYLYPLPNHGKNYKFTPDELKSLLDTIYEKGYEDGKNNNAKTEVTVYSMGVKCSRCGKYIPENEYKITAAMPDKDGNLENSFWCEDCYKQFISDIEKGEKAFKDVKPADK